MILTPDQQRVKTLLAETITLLCKNGLTFNSVFSIEALVGITLDNSHVILLNINETINKGDERISFPTLVQKSSEVDRKLKEHTNEFSVRKNSINDFEALRDGSRKKHKPISLDDEQCDEHLFMSAEIIKQTEDKDGIEGVALHTDNADDIVETVPSSAEGSCPRSNEQRRYTKKIWNNSPQECVSDNPRSTQSATDEIEQTFTTRDIGRNVDAIRLRRKRSSRKMETADDPSDIMEPEPLDSERTSDTKHSETFSEATLKQDMEKSFSDAIEIKQEINNEHESATDYYDYYSSSTGAPGGSSLSYKPEYNFPSSNDSFASGSRYAFDSHLDSSEAYKRKSWSERRSVTAPNHSNKRTRVKEQSSTFFDNDVEPFSGAQQNSSAPADWSTPASIVDGNSSELIIRCRECLKVFPTIQAYLTHLSVHRKRASSSHGRSVEGVGEKEIFYKYPCPCCDMTFSGHTNFRGHWSKHSGIKEFVCGVCGLRYAYKQMLKDHVLQHHPPSTWLNG